MSLFKRLGNVAKGKMKELGDAFDELADFGEPVPVEPDDDIGRPAVQQDSKSAPSSDKRAILDGLLAEGLLTEEEHAAKVAMLDVKPKTGPKKRHL